MNREEFEIFCYGKAPESVKPYVKRAVRTAEFLKIDFFEASASRVIMLAGALADAVKDLGGESAPKTLLELSPEGLIHADILIAEIQPSIMKLRHAFFGAESPPFPNEVDEAIRWLDEETHKQACELASYPSQPTLPEFQKIVTRTIPLYLKRKSRRLPGHQFKLIVEPLTIQYRGTDGQMKKRPIIRATPLHVIQDALQRISIDTGFAFDMLLVFLLTGIHPVIPALRIRTTVRKSKVVSVDFLRSMHNEELLSLHKVLQYAFRAGRKSLSSRSLEVYQFVNERGGIPVSGKEAFWRKLHTEWNLVHPERKFSSSGCLRVSYSRISDSSRGFVVKGRELP